MKKYCVEMDVTFSARMYITAENEETVKFRYNTTRSNSGTYWLGFEPSAVMV